MRDAIRVVDAVEAVDAVHAIDAIDAVLPQTQCRQCGYDGCRPYARAIAAGEVGIDRCPPGGDAGVGKLSRVTGLPRVALDPSRGVVKPLALAVIDEAACIGCTLCIQACPVDAIAGGAKRMHDVIADLCTGCELCLPPCPVDCIVMIPATFAWDDERAAAARARHDARARRLARQHDESLAESGAASHRSSPDDAAADEPPSPRSPQRKQAILDAAVARARDLRQRRVAASTAPS